MKKITYKTVLVKKERGIAWVTLNRPDKRNAISPQLCYDMVDVLTRLDTDPEVRVLVLTGAGEAFSAGMDLKEYFRALDDKPVERALAREAVRRFEWHKLSNFSKPTIAMVNGYCFGGAFGLVAACDLAVAAEDATFGLSEINWGIFPGSSLPKALSELVPFRDVMYYTLTGETFDGRKASEIRFVNCAVPQAQLKETTWRIAKTLIEKDPAALRTAKEVMKLARDMNYEETLAWTEAKGKELRLSTGHRWKKGVQQFKAGQYRPGMETYDWQESKENKK